MPGEKTSPVRAGVGECRESESDLAGVLLAASRGQESAWREIVERYTRRVFALARSRCRDFNVAEELTQSVFATVAAKLEQGLYTEQGRFEAWLFRVTMNRVRDHARRVKRQATTTDGDGLIEQRPAPSHDHAGVGDRDNRLRALRAAMEQLSDSDREVVELRHHGGLSFKQISELLEEPVGTLLARHHRALKKIKESIEGVGPGFSGREKSEVA